MADRYAQGYEDGLLAKQAEVDRLLEERGRLQGQIRLLEEQNGALIELLAESVEFHVQIVQENEELRKLGNQLFHSGNPPKTLSA